jgi:hypothetical protein
MSRVSRADPAQRGRDATPRPPLAPVPDDRMGLDPREVRQVDSIEALAGLLRHLRRRLARQQGGALLTYRDLAARTGWAHGVIGDYFAGKTLPPTDRFDTLVRLLGASRVEQGPLATARDRVEERRRGSAPAGGGTGGRPAGGWPAPRQLPPDAFAFTGREAELSRLDNLLRPGSGPGPMPACLLDGIGGAGTSALAIHAAHRVADRFPGGQLYVDLMGNDPAGPLPPVVALSWFLRALGHAGAPVPESLAEASALFRSQAAGRGLLVVLDNAYDAAQVRPLLPASPTCAVLVASGPRLITVDCAQGMHVDVLPPGDAVALLGRFAGPQRLLAQRPAAEEVARLCGYLPLALRIAGARLAARPGSPIRELADRLRDGGRLDALRYADLDVRRTFRAAQARLRRDASPLGPLADRALPVLAGADGDLTVAAAAALLGVPRPQAELVLERLVDARMLQTAGSGRYRFPELLRLFAGEQVTPPRHPVASGRDRDPGRDTAAGANLDTIG